MDSLGNVSYISGADSVEGHCSKRVIMATYATYIGGAYKGTDRFLREARKQGITRRVPANTARGFHFGERVVLLRYRGKGKVLAFGEMAIKEIIFDQEIAQKVAEALVEDGAAEYSPGPLGGTNIHRECGSYLIMGSFIITLPEFDIPWLCAKAQEIAKELHIDTVFCMIGGNLVEEYSTWLDPAPNFTRGFIKMEESDTFSSDGENKMVEISNYRRR